jgi:hypothetical protein
MAQTTTNVLLSERDSLSVWIASAAREMQSRNNAIGTRGAQFALEGRGQNGANDLHAIVRFKARPEFVALCNTYPMALSSAVARGEAESFDSRDRTIHANPDKT